ncbi:hypothetical protein B0H11DRAFT_2282623 [Mycena galericulata]|nr:hypothetical protein B0H11DRAFT_2282623 [Mycena galericulata]
MDDPEYLVIPFPPTPVTYLKKRQRNVIGRRRVVFDRLGRSSTNFVAVECLRALRIERTQFSTRALSLDMFPGMHIDIVLEILGHLHPLDLLHLSRTNREFRDLLYAPQLDKIWRAAFHAPLPPCPSEILGRRWAHLLFGSHTCEECGEPDTLPDFMVWRRLCSYCMSRKLTDAFLTTHHPDGIVGKLVAATDRRSGNTMAHGYTFNVSIRDANVVMAEYTRLAAEEGSQAAAALAAFVEHRKKIVRETQKIASQCAKWIKQISQRSKDRDAEKLRKVQVTVEKRLLEEGCDRRDAMQGLLDNLKDVKSLVSIRRLSSKRWNKSRPEVLQYVRQAKNFRLHAESTARRNVVWSGVANVLPHRPQSTWAYTPSIDTILAFPEFTRIINDDNVAALAKDDARLVEVLTKLPALLDARCVAKQTSLAAKIPGAHDPPDLQMLELATSVFTCGRRHECRDHVCWDKMYCCLVGWREAGSRHRESRCNCWSRTLSEPASAAARALVRLVGLDPKTATADEMDDVDHRFVCNDCPPTQRGREAMGWRKCLVHASEQQEKSDAGKHTSSWTLLSPKCAADVRRREGQDPCYMDEAWICVLCTVHFDKNVRRAAAIEHVSSEHHILRPIEGAHFMYSAGAHCLARPPVFLAGAAEYRCNRCAEMNPHLVKLFALRDLAAHVRDMHMIVPTENEWTRVERFITRPSPAI